MKTKRKSSFKKTILYLFFAILILGCKETEGEPQPDCGCDSKARGIVENRTGNIGYKVDSPPSPPPPYYDNHFWIRGTVPGAVAPFYIVCNEEILENEYGDLRKTYYESRQIKFSGITKRVCEGIIDLATQTYSRIILTSIERQ